MELFSAFNQLNWVAVILAALSSFVVGFVWYHEAVFGKVWMKLVGVSKKDISSTEGMGKAFGMTGLVSLLTAVVLGCLLIATNTHGLIDSKVFAFVVGLVLRAGTHIIHNGFARRPDTLTLIDGAHDVVAVTVMGGIFGLLQ